ncbi:uncharacterized protein BDZ99DRAFT_551007 [Mytilinidion resinicola]|uniref:Uncharacterized protein n=1 Tax=Mytilinidion resinicola TaxID=574789 RepID=A0A6A6Y4B7_9PEZI|nr:uncharacterized protein BDZ99DRAFT_551007 [Mytilinidion resinicola]KAF2802637.1 hypothetical protein BDZ99DRAFT_551007 [Mytilinidion resinicola]
MERRLSITLDALESLQPFHTTPLNCNDATMGLRTLRNSGGIVEKKDWAVVKETESFTHEDFPEDFPAEECVVDTVEPFSAWEHVLALESGGSGFSTSISSEEESDAGEGEESYDPFEGDQLDELEGETMCEALDQPQNESRDEPADQPKGEPQDDPLALPQDAPPQDAPPQDAPPQDAPPQDAPPQERPGEPDATHPVPSTPPHPQRLSHIRLLNPLPLLTHLVHRALTLTSLRLRANLAVLDRAAALLHALQHNLNALGNTLALHASLLAAARREYLLTRITANQAAMLALNARTIHALEDQVASLTALLQPLLDGHRLRGRLLARLREVEVQNARMAAQKAGERGAMLMAQGSILELIEENRRLREVNEEAVQGFRRLGGENWRLRGERDEAEGRGGELVGENEELRAENAQVVRGLAEMDGEYAALRETYEEAAGGLAAMVEEVREGPVEWARREGLEGVVDERKEDGEEGRERKITRTCGADGL